MTDRTKTICPPDLRSRGHKKNYCHSLGAWNAISLFFPTADIKECVFHWSQAVWRKIKELGFAVTYLRREATHRYLKQLMVLPFLPAQDIPAEFQQLRDRVITDSLVPRAAVDTAPNVSTSLLDCLPPDCAHE